jgi:hypothetical protein
MLQDIHYSAIDNVKMHIFQQVKLVGNDKCDLEPAQSDQLMRTQAGRRESLYRTQEKLRRSNDTAGCFLTKRYTWHIGPRGTESPLDTIKLRQNLVRDRKHWFRMAEPGFQDNRPNLKG